MNAIRSGSGITFELDDVERATRPLPLIRTDESIQKLIGTRVEACCDRRTSCIASPEFHPLIEATFLAFRDHRPLVLSPDMIWVTLLQGFAQHVNRHAEELRHLFVTHDDKLELVVIRNDFLPGSPENPWDELIDDFSSKIKGHLQVPYDSFVSNFSTTGRVERIACEVALVDAFQSYFSYKGVSLCGIPSVTLLGTIDDWGRLRAKVELLEPFGMNWWLPEVRRICDHFALAAEGIVDRAHWGDLCKWKAAYNEDVLNGWMTRLIPYVSEFGPERMTRNPLLRDPEAFVSSESMPTGVSCAPVTMEYVLLGLETKMEVLGGFVGIEQDPQTLALRPKLGWAVRNTERESRFPWSR